MIQYREIVRQLGLGLSQAQIAASCGCARKTVRSITSSLKERGLSFASIEASSDAELEALLFPEKHTQLSNRRMPDFERVSKELTRNGVTLKLLWAEYCEDCRQTNQQPFMYSQFCFHFQQYAEKDRATMHIPRKPGDRIEMDWAGDKMYLVDRCHRTGCSEPDWHLTPECMEPAGGMGGTAARTTWHLEAEYSLREKKPLPTSRHCKSRIGSRPQKSRSRRNSCKSCRL